MHIARIELEGRTGYRAVLHRSAESQVINVDLRTATGWQHFEVPGDDHDQLRAMATRIHHALEGCIGTSGDLQTYLRPIELMSDL